MIDFIFFIINGTGISVFLSDIGAYFAVFPVTFMRPVQSY